MTEFRDILIGTAGHIDHGKTRLVGCLTHIDTDRLPEEKARGISIDLGFAHWEQGEFRFGLVDVPGHERFVKNMVAGAAGVDLALLVIAADDGVMPQTREHLEIMDLLGLSTGVIAVTKTDLVDAEMLSLVQMEVEELVQGTFLEGCLVVPVSSETGEGIEELRQALVETARRLTQVRSHSWFRMPIDRVFTLTGHGTIVTGSVMSGEVHPGDQVELLPDQRMLRVRSVENHGVLTGKGHAGQRTAINLAGVKTEELHRGQELASPGILQPSQRLFVKLRHLPESPVQLKTRSELMLHLGTCEVPARVVFPGGELLPGEERYAELRTREPIAASYGQKMILRRFSPAMTIGGGTILDPGIPPTHRIRNFEEYGEACAVDSFSGRLGFLFSRSSVEEITPAQSAWRMGIPPEKFQATLAELKAQGVLREVSVKNSPRWIHRDDLERKLQSVMKTLRREFQQHHPRRMLPQTELKQVCREIAESAWLETFFQLLVERGELTRRLENLGPTDLQVKLSRREQQLRDQLLQQVEEGGKSPPTVKELADLHSVAVETVSSLCNGCADEGLLLKISDQFYFSPQIVEEFRAECQKCFVTQPTATVSELREYWGVSRKFAVPLAEYFDQRQWTVRSGNDRKPGPHITDSVIN